MKLYLLSRFSFNRKIVFNKDYKFTESIGHEKFSNSAYREVQIFLKKLKKKDVTFISSPFNDVELKTLSIDDFVYCDPPYLITDAFYNKYWSNESELLLYATLDDLNNQGVKFALSNVSHHKGMINNILLRWVKRNKYKMINLQCRYSNYGSSNAKNQRLKTQEVLIINYDKQPDINMNGIFEM